MMMNETDDVELGALAWAVAESIRKKFGPLVEIDPVTSDHFWISSKGFAAEVRVGEPVELTGRFPIQAVRRIPLCNPRSRHLIVEQIRRWIGSARNPAT